MKKNSIKAMMGLLFLFCSNLLSAQNKLETVPSNVTRLELKNVIRVDVYTPGAEKGYMIVSGDNNVKISFTGNVMNVENKGNNSMPQIKVYHDFTEIEVQDMAQLNLENLKSSVLTITSKDNARVSGSGEFAQLNLVSKGASYVTIEGTAKTLTANSRDASNINVDGLTAEVATVTSTDVSTVRVKATKTLVADAQNLSRIIYNGEPAESIVVNTKDFARVREASSEDDVNIVTGGTEDTMRVRVGGKKLIIINDIDNKITKKDPGKKKTDKKELKSVWGGFEIGMSSFTTPDLNFKQDAPYGFLDNNVGKSWFWGLNLMETDIHLVKNKFALTTGFGMNWANYRFGNTAVLVPDVDSLKANLVIDKLSNNRLRVYSLDVPVMLKLAPRKKGAHLAAGVILSYSPGIKLITESESKGYKEEIKVRDDFNVNPFRATATVRVGYGWLRLFANYSLTPYFSKSAGPDVRSFQAGLTVIPF